MQTACQGDDPLPSVKLSAKPSKTREEGVGKECHLSGRASTWEPDVELSKSTCQAQWKEHMKNQIQRVAHDFLALFDNLRLRVLLEPKAFQVISAYLRMHCVGFHCYSFAHWLRASTFIASMGALFWSMVLLMILKFIGGIGCLTVSG